VIPSLKNIDMSFCGVVVGAIPAFGR